MVDACAFPDIVRLRLQYWYASELFAKNHIPMELLTRST